MGRRERAWGMSALLLGGGCHRPFAAPEGVTAESGLRAQSISPARAHALFTALLAHVRPGGPNHMHSRRLFFYAPSFARASGAAVDEVAAAAILHDIAKEAPAGDPKERLCMHHEAGASMARAILSAGGWDARATERVVGAIREHIGPVGLN